MKIKLTVSDFSLYLFITIHNAFVFVDLNRPTSVKIKN